MTLARRKQIVGLGWLTNFTASGLENFVQPSVRFFLGHHRALSPSALQIGDPHCYRCRCQENVSWYCTIAMTFHHYLILKTCLTTIQAINLDIAYLVKVLPFMAVLLSPEADPADEDLP